MTLKLKRLAETRRVYSLLRHVDHRLWSGVTGGREVVAVSLHADGLQPVLHRAHRRRRLGAAGLQQGGVGPGGGLVETRLITASQNHKSAMSSL